MVGAAVAPAAHAACTPGDRTSALLAEGRQPVVLLVADAVRGGAPVVPVITAHGGFVARQRGRRYVGVFASLRVDDPVRAAVAAARELCDVHGMRAARHLAPVLVRAKDRGAPLRYFEARPRSTAPRPGCRRSRGPGSG